MAIGSIATAAVREKHASANAGYGALWPTPEHDDTDQVGRSRMEVADLLDD
jgi:hypothetical protein